MAYNRDIDDRIKAIVDPWPDMDSKKMFGGIGYLQRGNMLCGVHKNFLVLRLGPENGQQALQVPHVKPFDITGRPMKGWVMVATQGFNEHTVLSDWLNKARQFVETLPSR